MRNKSIVLALILIIASTGICTGVSLAAGTVHIYSIGKFYDDEEFSNDFPIIVNEESVKTIRKFSSAVYYEDVEFTNVFSVSDNEIDKDVAEAVAIRSPDGSGFQFTISNAYPGYEVHLDFTIKNIGDHPIGDLCPIVLLDIPDLFYDTDAFLFEIEGIDEGGGLWLVNVGDTADGRFTIKVLQGAEEDTSYLHNEVTNYNVIMFHFIGGDY